MKNLALLGLSVVLLFTFACKNSSQNTAAGQNTDTIPTLTLENFDSLAPQYVDKLIKITGIVDHVCKHGGKKILLVSPTSQAELHVYSDERFSDTLTGNKVTLIGKVQDFVIDENYLTQKENEAKSKQTHESEEHYQEVLKTIQHYRDSMKKLGVTELHSYSLKFVKFVK